jgi:hypothetical protein
VRHCRSTTTESSGWRVPVDRETLDRALRLLTEDPDRSAELGTLAVIYGVQVQTYQRVMDDIVAVSSRLRGAAAER